MPVVHLIVVVLAVTLITVVLWEVFETMVVPRLISRGFRLTRLYFRTAWRVWSAIGRRIPLLERRELELAIFGPLALLGMLTIWALLLILAFALVLWGLGSPLADPSTRPARFGSDLYFSSTTFLTLGLGDVVPHTGLARAIVVIEVATGFGLLVLVIGYLPTLYQAFSHREQRISLLDAHAGSPPSASALLVRHPPDRRSHQLTLLLGEWEIWSAELLETHLSYPVLAYYRSQHENQSWVAALAIILDTCTILLACDDGLLGGEELVEQAAFTFAMARHAAVDLDQYFQAPRTRLVAHEGRLPLDERAQLCDALEKIANASGAGTRVDLNVVGGIFDELRVLYEPYLEGLAAFLLMDLPPWVPRPDALDDWQTTADDRTAPSIAKLLAHRHARRLGV